MRMKKLKTRLLSILLVISMVLPSNLATLGVQAASDWSTTAGEEYVLDVENGKMTCSELYNALVNKYSKPSYNSSLTAAGFRYGIDSASTELKTWQGVSTDYGSESAGLQDGKTYQIERCTGRTWSTYKYVYNYTAQTAFTVRYYYTPSVTVSGLSDGSTYDVKLNNVSWNKAHKIYSGENNATLYVAPVTGYKAIVTYGEKTLTLDDNNETKFTVSDATTEIKVEYKEDTIPQATVNLTKAGSGSVTGITDGGSYDVDKEIEITVVPEGNYYVEGIYVDNSDESIEITSKDSSTRSYLAKYTFKEEKTYSVKVVFAEKKLEKNETIGTVGFNPKKGVSSQLDTLKQNIFNAVVNSDESLPEGLEYTDLTYEYYQVDKIFSSTSSSTKGLTEDSTGYYYFGERGLGVTEKIKLTWAGDEKYPTLSIDANITLVEGREAATINYTKPAEVEFETAEDIETAVLNAASTNSSSQIKATRVTENLPTGGQTATLTYKLSVAEDNNYLANEIEVTIDVKAKSNPAQINIVYTDGSTVGTVSVGSLTSSGTLVAGNYDIKVTPGTDIGYVASVKVDGTEIGNDYSKYSNRTFTDTISIKNDTTYTITVTFAERKLALTNKTSLEINGYSASTRKTTYLSEVTADKFVDYDECIGGSASSDNCVVKMQYKFGAETISNLVNNNIQLVWQEYLDAPPSSKTLEITWNGDNRYPNVTATKSVSVVEARSAAVIDTSNVSTKTVTLDSIDGTLTDEDKAAIIAAISGVKVSDGAATPVYTVTDGQTAPGQGESKEIEVTISVAENENYLAATSKTVKVTVEGKVHPATVTVADTENGTVKITTTPYEGTDKFNALKTGLITFTATPDKGYYVKDVKITTTTEVAVTDPALETSYNASNVYSGEFAITNGTKDETKEYVITVTFAKWEIPLKDEFNAVFYNFGDADSDENKDFYERVHLAAVDGTAPGEYSVELKDGATLTKGENTFVITWEATNRYPEVSTEVTIKVEEDREPATITVNENVETVEVDGELKETDRENIINAAKAAVTGVSVNAKPSYEIVENSITIPTQGNTDGTVDVLVTLEDGKTYLGTSVVVTVPLKGTLHPATVNITQVGTGNVTVKQGDTVIESGKTYNSGELTITAEPTGTYYVDYITVNGNKIDMTQVDGTINFTASTEIKDGKGESANAEDKVYDIKVVFAERTLPIKNPLGTVGYNPETSVTDEYVSSIEAAIFEAIIGSDNVAGITQDDVEIKFYIGTTGFEGYHGLGDSLLLASNFYFKNGFGTAINDGALQDKETIQITLKSSGKYPAITKEGISVTVVDSRSDAGLYDQDLGSYRFDNEEDITTYVKSTMANPNGVTISSVELVEGKIPEECNTPATVKYQVTFDGDETYKADSCVVTLTVVRNAAKCTIVADNDATAHGKVSGTGEVDGLTNCKITVTPDDGYAVKSITVKYGLLDLKTPEDLSDVTYTYEETEILGNVISSKREASVTFTTDGTEGAVEYTVYVEYEKIGLNVKENPTITYCYDQKTVSATKLKELVFDAVYDETSSYPKCTVDDVTIEYASFSLLGQSSWTDISSSPTIEINGVTHKFGEDGTEKIRISYKDDKYGRVSAEVDLTVYDACYNNTIDVKEVNDELDGSVDISASIDPEYKTYDGNDKYKENTEYTVTVAPGNSVLNAYPEEAAYVKSIVITDKDGNEVETSKLSFKEAEEIFGISYKEPTAYVTFTTGSNEDYTVTVTYGTMKFDTYLALLGITLDMYPGVEGNYEDEVPTAEEIFNAVIKGAEPEELATYDADNMTVEYSTNNGVTYKSLDTLLDVADGTTVLVRISYNGDLQYHTIAATKEVKLLDPRNESVITNEEAEEAVEFVDDDELGKEILNAINAKVKGVDDAEIIVRVDNTYVDEETGKSYVDVTLIYEGSTTQKPTEKEVKGIEVLDIPDVALVTVSSDSEGTITLNGQDVDELEVRGGSTVEITAHRDGYAVEKITVEETGKLAKAVGDTTELELKYKDQVASASFKPEEKTSYEVSVEYVPAEFTFNDEITFLPGITEPTEEYIYDEAVASPVRAEGSDITVQYLARPAGTKATIEIPKIEILGQVIYEGGSYEFDLPELWLDVDTEIEDVDLSDITTKIANGEISITDLTNSIGKMQINAHEFGTQEEETIRVSYEDNKWLIGETETTVKIVDTRIPTEITGTDATVKYGFTADELIAAIGAKVTAEGADTGLAVEVVTNIDGLEVSSTPYEIKVKFAGNETYQPCEATFNVTVEKAPCTIDYDSQFVRYGDDYDFTLVKKPEDVKTIDFAIGLNVKDGITKADGFVQIVLPGVLGQYISGEFSLSQFEDIMNTLANLGLTNDLLDGIGFDSTTVDQLFDILYKIEEQLGENDLTIKVNGEIHPTDIGVYLAGAVTADSNYETAYTIDYLVIYPDGTKVDLEYDYKDENGILTSTLLKEGIYTLDASAYLEGEKNEDATEIIEHLFFGVDGNGEFQIISTQNGGEFPTEVGAWTQLTYTADWGNEMYYGKPIGRAFLIVPEQVDVQFVDENGNEIKADTFTYDGTPKSMNAVVYDKEGNKLSEELTSKYLTVTYTGYSLKNPEEVYYSKEAPTQAGVYTAIAIYNETEDSASGPRFGITAAVMTITPAESKVTVDDKVHTYDGNPVDVTTMITKEPEDAQLAIITAGIKANGSFEDGGLETIDGTVNVDFPASVDKYIKQILPKAYEDGITLSDFIAKVDEIKEKLAENNMNVDALEKVVETLKQMPDKTTLTFKEQADVNPSDIGMYLVTAVTMDANYAPAADAGILIIAPKTTKADLAWNYMDGKDVIVVSAADIKDIDLDASAYVENEYNEEITEDLKYLYIGINADGETVTTSDKTTLGKGVYTEIAYYVGDLDSDIKYAEPIIRTIIVAAENVNVDFVDESGAVNNDRSFTWDGEPHAMDVRVTEKDGTEITGDRLAENLTVTYIGVDVSNGGYRSTEAPSEVGAYTVIAVYEEYNENGERIYFGIDVGAMVIKPTEATITVDNNTVEYDGTEKFVDMTYNTSIEPIAIVIDESYNINIILPEEWNVGTKVIDVAGGLESIIDVIGKIIENVDSEEAAQIAELLPMIKQILQSEDMIKTVTINGSKPVEVGTYAIFGIALDRRHLPAYASGVLVITEPEEEKPEVELKDADFSMEDVTVEYDGEEHFVTITNPEELNVITVTTDEEGNVNILLPEGWEAESIADVIEQIEDLAIETVDEVVEKLETAIENAENVTINGSKPVEVGTYEVYGIAFAEGYLVKEANATVKITEKEEEPVTPELKDAKFEMTGTEVEYDGKEHFVTVEKDDALSYIAVVTDGEGNVNILLPEGWEAETVAELEELIQNSGVEKADEVIEKLEAAIEDAEDVTINGAKPVEVGTYEVYGIAFAEGYLVKEANATVKITEKAEDPVVPEDKDADFSMEDVTVEYDGEEHFVTVTNTDGLDVISIVADENGNVNVILPEAWDVSKVTLNVTNGLKKALTEIKYYVNQANVSDADEVMTEIETVLNNLEISTLTINGSKPVEVGEYQITGIAFKDGYKVEVDDAVLKITEAEKEPEKDPDPEKPGEDKDADFSMEDVEVKYDGKEHFVTVTNTDDLDVISVVADENGNVNIILPEAWNASKKEFDVTDGLDEVLAEVRKLAEDADASDIDEVMDMLETVLSALEINTLTINGSKPVEIGEYQITGIAFKDGYKVEKDNAVLKITEAEKEPEKDPDPEKPEKIDAEFAIEDATYTYDGKEKLVGITNPESLDVILISVDEKGNVNIVLPETWNVSKTEVDITGGLDGVLDKVRDIIEQKELSDGSSIEDKDEIIEAIENALKDLEISTLTINAGNPIEVGVYDYTGIAFNNGYEVKVDTATLTIKKADDDSDDKDDDSDDKNDDNQDDQDDKNQNDDGQKDDDQNDTTINGSDNGKGNDKTEAGNSTKTGDEARTLTYLFALLFSLIAAFVVLIIRRRNYKKH